MSTPLEIRLPETGIVESVRAKLENAREKLAHFDVDLIVEKEDGECEYPVIDVVESIEDCAIDYPDSITSAFFEVYSETMQKKIPRQTLIYKLRPENRLVETFIKSLNLAFLISVSALSTEKCLKYFEQYRNLSGYWKKPVFPYDRSGGTFKTLREHQIIYESLQQRMVFAMVYCLCVKHPSNVEGSELKELLQFIYDSSKEIPQLIDRIFQHQIPLWYKNPQHTTSHKEDTCAQRERNPKPLFNDEEKEYKKSEFYNIIQYEDPQALQKRLHQLIDGKKGADVGCVLLKCKQDGYITRNPTQGEFKSEFELNGSWAAIHKYMDEGNMNALDRANKVIIFE